MKFHNKTVYIKPNITCYILYKLSISTKLPPSSITEVCFSGKKPVSVLVCAAHIKHTPIRTHFPTAAMDESALKQLQLKIDEALAAATAAQTLATAAEKTANAADKKATEAVGVAEKSFNLSTNIADKLGKIDKLEEDQLTSRALLESLTLSVDSKFNQLIGHFDQQTKRETARRNADRKVALEAICHNENVCFRVMPVNPSHTIGGLPLLDVTSQANTQSNLIKIIQNLDAFQHFSPGQQTQVRNGSAITNITIDKTTKDKSINSRGFVVQCPNVEIASTIKTSLRKEVKWLQLTQIRSPYKYIAKMRMQIHNQLSPLLKPQNNRAPPVLYFKVKSDIITIDSNVVLAVKVCITTMTREVITLANNVPPTGANHSVLGGKRGGCLEFKLQGNSEESGCSLITHSITNAFLQAIENSDFLQKYPNIFEPCSPIEQHTIEEQPIQTPAASEPNTAVQSEPTQAAIIAPATPSTYAPVTTVTACPAPVLYTQPAPINATPTPTSYPPNCSVPPPSSSFQPDRATQYSTDFPAIIGPYPTTASSQARDQGNAGLEVPHRPGHNYPTRRGRVKGIKSNFSVVRGPI